MQIDSDIIPADQKKCDTCGQIKKLTEFSLTYGRRSKLRKSFCITCEKTVKAVNELHITQEQYKAITSLPCLICNAATSGIDVDSNGRLIAALCKRCQDFVNGVNSEIALAAHNYLMLKENFPAFLTFVTEELAGTHLAKEAPLLDHLESICANCGKPVITLPTGKRVCNCQVWE